MTEERKFQPVSWNSNLVDNTDANLNTLGQVLVSATRPPANLTTSTSGCIQTNSFPAKLHRMLTDVENGDDGLDQYIGWSSQGRAFVIRDREKFISEVMPRYFYHFKFNSFTRQLNLFGFRRISKEGSFYHEHFLRGKPELVNKIQRIKGGKRTKKTEDPGFDALQHIIKEGVTQSTDKNAVTEAEKETESDAATNCNQVPVESFQSKAVSSKWFSDTPNHIKSEVNLNFDDAKELLAPIVNSIDATSVNCLQQELNLSTGNGHHQAQQEAHDSYNHSPALFQQQAANHRPSLAGGPRGLSFIQEAIGNTEPSFSLVNCHQDIDQLQMGNIFQHHQCQIQHVLAQANDTISLGQTFPTQQHQLRHAAETADGAHQVDLASLQRQQQIIELQIQGLKQQEQFLRLSSEQQF